MWKKAKMVVLVLVVVGALIIVLYFTVRHWLFKKEVEFTEHILQQTKQALQVYKIEYGTYPEPTNWCYVLMHPQGSNVTRGIVYLYTGPDRAPPTDAWGYVLEYRRQSNGFKVISVGPDGKMGSSDDVHAVVDE